MDAQNCRNRLDSFSYLYNVVYANGLWVTVGTSGALFSSSDGVQWTPRESDTANDLFGVGFGNGHWVAVADYGTILESGSIVRLALRWTPSGGGAELTLTGPVGQSCLIHSTADFVNWTSLTSLLLSNGTGQFIDSSAGNSGMRFYRAAAP